MTIATTSILLVRPVRLRTSVPCTAAGHVTRCCKPKPPLQALSFRASCCARELPVGITDHLMRRVCTCDLQVAELLAGVAAPVLYWEQGHEWVFGDPVRLQVCLDILHGRQTTGFGGCVLSTLSREVSSLGGVSSYLQSISSSGAAQHIYWLEAVHCTLCM